MTCPHKEGFEMELKALNGTKRNWCRSRPCFDRCGHVDASTRCWCLILYSPGALNSTQMLKSSNNNFLFLGYFLRDGCEREMNNSEMAVHRALRGLKKAAQRESPGHEIKSRRRLPPSNSDEKSPAGEHAEVLFSNQTLEGLHNDFISCSSRVLYPVVARFSGFVYFRLLWGCRSPLAWLKVTSDGN